MDVINGIIQAIWGILSLIITLLKALGALFTISLGDMYNAGRTLLFKFLGFSVDLLLMNPFNVGSGTYMGPGFGEGSVTSGGTAESSINMLFSSGSGMGLGAGIGTLIIEAGLALTLIAFFYGFSESSVQLEKTNIQLIFSRILRWIIAVGLVTVSYQMIGYLFLAFRSLYGSFTGIAGGNAETWFTNKLSTVWPEAGNLSGSFLEGGLSADQYDSMFGVNDFSGSMWDIDATTSLRYSFIGPVIMLLGILKLFKKLVKYVISFVPNLFRVLVLFICAPFALAMYASPETQQKANSYIRLFAASVLTNLLKVISITMACVIAINLTMDGTCILNTYPLAVQLTDSAFGAGALSTDIAFIMTSGGLLGMNLLVDLLTKTSEVSDRFAQEVLA